MEEEMLISTGNLIYRSGYNFFKRFKISNEHRPLLTSRREVPEAVYCTKTLPIQHKQ